MARFQTGNRNASKKIPDSEIGNILARRANNESYSSIARSYDVTSLTISRICNGESRRDATKGLVEEELIEFNIDTVTIDPSEAAKAEEAIRQMDFSSPVPKRVDAAALFLQSRDSGLEIDRRSDMIDKQENPNDASNVETGSKSDSTESDEGSDQQHLGGDTPRRSD